jgi:hypothetical protein
MKTNGLTTHECLKALIDRDESARAKLVAFTATTEKSVPRWLSGSGPNGANLIRVRVFLAEHGLIPVELEHVDDTVFTFGRLYAHRIIDDATALVGSSLSSIDSLYHVLLVKGGTSKAVLEKMKMVNASYAGRLPLISLVSDASSLKQKTAVVAPVAAFVPTKQTAIEMLAHIAALAKPFADIIVSANLTPEDCKAFRSECGYDAATKASTAFNRLLR